jgi:hypothetical protein
MVADKKLALSEELDRRLAEIEPADYSTSFVVGIPKGAKELGEATEQMKCLWTLWSRLERDNSLGSTELLKRAVHTAISYEIGTHFNYWRARIGINSSWQVYSVTSQ